MIKLNKLFLMLVIVLFLIPLNTTNVGAEGLSNNSLVEESDESLEGNSLVEDEEELESTEGEDTEQTEETESGEYEVTESEDGSITASSSSINPIFAAVAGIGAVGLIAALFIGGKKK